MPVSDLTAGDFPAFFRSLWGRDPFAWQTALASRVMETAAWPEAIALPTGAGKTACLDIAVFALAAQAPRLERGEIVTAPRRIFLVVDRRIVVDEAYDRARRMAGKLAESAKRDENDDVLCNVAHNLLRIGGQEGSVQDGAGARPLEAHVLRGGMYRSEAWGQNPLQPSIIASTVDQTGSRLLFRAYGRRRNVWPVYAGLVANDSLILLDEAHCARPFLQTLQAVARFREWGKAPLGRFFHPVVMSATPPTDMEDRFEDTSGEGDDPEHPLGKRRMARKPAILKTTKSASTDDIAKVVARQALQLADDGSRAVVAFVNRVATARRIREILYERENIDCELLTGRMRPVDREIVHARLQCLHSSRSETRCLERPLIVVATQTLEVGADFDFDGLVTECASLDALRQRFGRLNRMGRPIEARAVVVAARNPPKDDPVYGSALAETWDWLKKHGDDGDAVDFGIAALGGILPEGKALDALNAPFRDAAVMLPAHVDCLAQTSPEPAPSPDVSLFLRGRRRAVADVHVCWRADLDLEKDPQELEKTELTRLRLCPPASAETLPVPLGVFKRWLEGDDTDDVSADIEGGHAEETDSRRRAPTGDRKPRRIVRWRGRETRAKDDVTDDPQKVRPGDVIVIPFEHFNAALSLGDIPDRGENGDRTAAHDVGDRAHLRARAKAVLRLHRTLVEAWPDDFREARESALALLSDHDIERMYEDDPDGLSEGLLDILKQLRDHGRQKDIHARWRWLPKSAAALVKEYDSPRRLSRAVHVVGGSPVVAGKQIVPEYALEADRFNDEDDINSSGTSYRNGKPVLLKDHLPGVEGFARSHAEGCGLPAELTKVLTCAGLLHDLGKADPRFQSMLRGGERWNGLSPQAKSAQMNRSHTRRKSDYPRGVRHELLSVRMAESAPDLLPKEDDLRDLTLHLVASHHGFCRPFAPVTDGDDYPEARFEVSDRETRWDGGSLELERLDSGVAERYWRLTRRYGWWGLAWLEALLRLADWRRSAWEEENDDGA